MTTNAYTKMTMKTVKEKLAASRTHLPRETQLFHRFGARLARDLPSITTPYAFTITAHETLTQIAQATFHPEGIKCLAQTYIPKAAALHPNPSFAAQVQSLYALEKRVE